jgi:hypothetical protein
VDLTDPLTIQETHVATGAWLTPLVLLPGVAMLVMSMSVRYGQIHQEFHHLVGEKASRDDQHAESLMHRATLFRNALVGLYASVTAFALGSMLGGFWSLLSADSVWFVQGLTVLGVLALVYSSFQLVRESVLSLHVLRRHWELLSGE